MTKKTPTYGETDYHNFSHRGTDKTKRKLLNIGNIYCNAVECTICGYYIRSRNKHDMVTCKCGNVSVDGGSWYQKLSSKDITKVESRLELYNDVDTE